jgi:hypothetical protein
LVLSGAEELLKHVTVLEIEVEFIEIYKKQPLFADIDAFLRARGFVLHRFLGMAGRTFKLMLWKNDLTAAMSQVLWSDAVYVRDFMAFDRLEPERLAKLGATLLVNYRSTDLAALAVAAHDRQTGGRLQEVLLREIGVTSGGSS